jgi:hypothetical protein
MKKIQNFVHLQKPKLSATAKGGISRLESFIIEAGENYSKIFGAVN